MEKIFIISSRFHSIIRPLIVDLPIVDHHKPFMRVRDSILHGKRFFLMKGTYPGKNSRKVLLRRTQHK